MSQLSKTEQHQPYQLIIGLGKTGFACARFLHQTRPNTRLVVADNRLNPPFYQTLKDQQPDTSIHLGEFSESLCMGASKIIVSPGVNLSEPAIHQASLAGVPIISDIELFALEAKAPIVAITGTNGKSTVTGWVYDMATQAGLKASIGGNYGTPAVDLLDDAIQLYVLEVSSFQLDVTHNLGAKVACLLNITPDHLDRHGSFSAYCKAKYKVFNKCQYAVTNQDEAITNPPTLIEAFSTQGIKHQAFTLSIPQGQQYGVCHINQVEWICYGQTSLLPSGEVSLPGRHNLSNALAALAIGTALELPRSAMVDSLRSFMGLNHRSEAVLTHKGVTYINDSKGTNAAATAAAIESFGNLCAGQVLLIAGGDAKGGGFTELLAPAQDHVKKLYAYGKDGHLIANTLASVCPTELMADLNMAVQQAYAQAQAGDLVLLSPACSSLDQFTDFNHRGDVFKAKVKALVKGEAHNPLCSSDIKHSINL